MKVFDTISINLLDHPSYDYIIMDLKERAIKLKLALHETHSNHTSFWIPLSALEHIDSNKYFIKEWFFNYGSLLQLKSLGYERNF